MDKSGKLHFEEYLKLCRGLIGTKKVGLWPRAMIKMIRMRLRTALLAQSWRQSIALKVSVAVLMKAVVFPFAGILICKVGIGL